MGDVDLEEVEAVVALLVKLGAAEVAGGAGGQWVVSVLGGRGMGYV